MDVSSEYNNNFSTLALTEIGEEVFSGKDGYASGPERTLLSALLFDGVQAYIKFYTSPTGKGIYRYLEAVQWVNKRDSEYVFSFDQVCEALGVNPNYLRLGLSNVCSSKTERPRKRARRSF